jgi:small-conductance mechanosensitive channel
MDLSTTLDYTFLDNPLRSWIIAVAVAVLVFVAVRIARGLVVSRVGKLARKTDTQWDDLVIHILSRTRSLAIAAVAVYAGANVVTLAPQTMRILGAVTAVALLLQGGIWVHSGLDYWFGRYRERKAVDGATVTVMSAVGFLSKVTLWAVIVLVALDNVGVKVTAFVAGLGVGGIAIALALQNILSDLFASLSIVLDRPFVVGDFIIVGDMLGTVDHVGLKTTRVRSLSGEQLVFSNNDLLSSRIRNFGRMHERRVIFAIGVTYQTPREKLAEIPTIIREAVEAQEQTRFDRSHLKEFGAFSIDFETVFYVLSREYNLYMDIQQAVNLGIHEAFEREGIEFAYPTQTLFVVKEPSA